jgi:hypothetical protein
MDDTARSMEFVALGHARSEHYARLETFPNMPPEDQAATALRFG